MNKGLEAKNRLVNKCSEYLNLSIDHQVAEDFLTIEKELKEYESYRGFLDNVEKGIVTYTPRDTWEEERKKLKALEKLKQYWNNKIPLSVPQGLKIVSTLEKELKALEIIKPLVHLTKDANGCWLWLGLNGVQITQEQYDSLKEVEL